MYFDVPQNYIVQAISAKEVKIKTTCFGKQRVIMVILCITVDGHKLQALVILSSNTMPKNGLFPEVLMRTHKHGEMVADFMKDLTKYGLELCIIHSVCQSLTPFVNTCQKNSKLNEKK
jgi:hypothetical protein